MSAELEISLVLWTARLAVAAYLVRLFVDIAGWPRDPIQRKVWRTVIQSIWTFGCLCYLLHVMAAFQFVHHWSHSAAAAHTAAQSAELTGWDWSGGLWINYAFTIWWPLDVIASWRRGIDRLPKWYVVGLHSIVGFLVFNATVVFGPPAWRAIAVVVFAVLIALAIRRGT